MKNKGNLLLKSVILIGCVCYAVPAILATTGIKLLAKDKVDTDETNERHKSDWDDI